MLTDLCTKICKKSTDRTRKITNKMNKIHRRAFGAVGALRAPTLWVLLILLLIFLVRSVDFLQIFLHISVNMYMLMCAECICM